MTEINLGKRKTEHKEVQQTGKPVLL